MRAVMSIAVLAVALAGAGTASAADYAVVHGADASRAGQVWVFDDQPGVYVRAYWRTPWQNRHYYPFTGKAPKIGRREHLSDVRPAPRPAETYYRAWSTNALYPPAPVRVPANIGEPEVAPVVVPVVPLGPRRRSH